MVTLTHPRLSGRDIEVSEQRVRHFERAGWRRRTSRRERTAARSAVEAPAEPAASDTTEGDA